MSRSTPAVVLPSGPFRPVRRRVESAWHPTDLARSVRDDPLAFALTGSWFGGGAVIGWDPVFALDPASGVDPFDLLDSVPTVPDADDGAGTGVFGGWVGYLGYQTGRLIERLPGSPPRPHPLPDWWLAWHDTVMRFDPATGWWFEALTTAESDDRIDQRFGAMRELLQSPPPDRVRPVELAPFTAVPDGDDHRKAVRRALDLIMAGDIYQANVCLRLSSQLMKGSSFDLYATGIEQLLPNHGAYLDLGSGRAVASFSPEQFLRRQGRQVVTRPIKGTRQRVDSEATDLSEAPKDRAENVMIVDLMRNDLGRVCAPGSISVPRLFDLEAHPGVWHLVSEVRGELRPGIHDGGLLRATLPPGSVTGAPKVRAMEVIAEVEATGREIYTGTIGMVSPVAGADWSVAIRTFEMVDDHVWLGVGGGIVAESDPDAELAECLTKARPLIDALGGTIEPLG